MSAQNTHKSGRHKLMPFCAISPAAVLAAQPVEANNPPVSQPGQHLRTTVQAVMYAMLYMVACCCTRQRNLLHQATEFRSDQPAVLQECLQTA